MKNYELTHDPLIVKVTEGDNSHLIYCPTRVQGDYNPAQWEEYQAWLSEGNTPSAYEEPILLAPLTPAEKLASAGLTVEELKSLLDL